MAFYYFLHNRWSRGSVLALSTQFRGFKPGRSRRIFKGEKILSTPSFGEEVKPPVPCRRFAACKRSLNGKITGQHSRPHFHLPPLESLASWRTWRHLMAKVGKSKRGGKQWQTTPKNLLRMQPTGALSVAWLSSGLCPNRPKDWISIITIMLNKKKHNKFSQRLYCRRCRITYISNRVLKL